MTKARLTRATKNELIRNWKRALRTYHDRPEVAAIDIGWGRAGEARTKELAVRVHVRSENFGRPKGVEVVQIHRSPRCADEVPRKPTSGLPRVNRERELRPGHSLSGPDAGFATLGAIVWDKADKRAGVLGSWHGVAGPFARARKKVVHPSAHDGMKPEKPEQTAASTAPGNEASISGSDHDLESLQRNWVASLPDNETRIVGPGGGTPQNQEVDRHKLISAIRRGVSQASFRASTERVAKKHALFDVAFAHLETEILDMNGDWFGWELFDLGIHVGSARQLGLSDVWNQVPVFKSSRTTGVTHGTVDGVGVYFLSYCCELERIPILGFRIVPRADTDQKGAEPLALSAPGDSGALWVTEGRQAQAVGVHIDGDDLDDEEYAIACHVKPALDRLGLSLKELPR